MTSCVTLVVIDKLTRWVGPILRAVMLGLHPLSVQEAAILDQNRPNPTKQHASKVSHGQYQK